MMSTLLANAVDIPSPEIPRFLHSTEGPFRDFDLLAIGWVLVAVLLIQLVRRITKSRRRKSSD